MSIGLSRCQFNNHFVASSILDPNEDSEKCVKDFINRHRKVISIFNTQ